MKYLLKDIATIQTGLYPSPNWLGNDVAFLQARHFDENGVLTAALLPELPLNDQTEKHLLQEGDLLFAAKGSKNFVALYRKEFGPCVASSTFLVIKLANKEVEPAYLAWFMNFPTTQKLLKGNAIGTSLPSIPKNVLQELEIDVPTPSTQHTIVKIHTLQQKATAIQMQIIELRATQIHHLLLKASQK
ncbi:restriction endonuclease subunit S [Runella aurantiaca]|uniref:Type I restriction modification DNA specificity domain-containing protein n=1 Tax=Runella aurantiaca TaxID=2282308 RepID=A0A369IDI6_9BACT|nr:restriction endonuclease subunit S [Runella aurantiaca]RDB06910.1 hypothetical protein DVG78_06430 [Runella aurantiaca]